jgi:hypothetical protein
MSSNNCRVYCADSSAACVVAYIDPALIYHHACLPKPNITSFSNVRDNVKCRVYLKEPASVDDIHTTAAAQIKLLELGAGVD